MNKLSIKKWLILSLIAISAVACFCFSSTDLSKIWGSNKIEIAREEDYVESAISNEDTMLDWTDMYNWYKGNNWVTIDGVKYLKVSTVDQLYAISRYITNPWSEYYGAVPTSRNINSNVFSTNYILTNDIDVSSYYGFDPRKKEMCYITDMWQPIGTSPSTINGLPVGDYLGTFNGDGYSITGVNITTGQIVESYDSISKHDMAEIYAGLFGYVTGTIKNLRVEIGSFNINYESSGGIERSADIKVGGLVGYSCGDITDCIVDYSKYNSVQVNVCDGILGDEVYLGGLVGSIEDGDIGNVIVRGVKNFTAESDASHIADGTFMKASEFHIGGLAGRAFDTNIDSSIFMSDNSSESYVFNISIQNLTLDEQNNLKINYNNCGALVGCFEVYYSGEITSCAYDDKARAKVCFNNAYLTDREIDMYKPGGNTNVATDIGVFTDISKLPNNGDRPLKLDDLYGSFSSMATTVSEVKAKTKEWAKVPGWNNDEIIQMPFAMRNMQKVTIYNLKQMGNAQSNPETSNVSEIGVLPGLDWDTLVKEQLNKDGESYILSGYGVAFKGLSKTKDGTLIYTYNNTTDKVPSDLSTLPNTNGNYYLYAVWDYYTLKANFYINSGFKINEQSQYTVAEGITICTGFKTSIDFYEDVTITVGGKDYAINERVDQILQQYSHSYSVIGWTKEVGATEPYSGTWYANEDNETIDLYAILQATKIQLYIPTFDTKGNPTGVGDFYKVDGVVQEYSVANFNAMSLNTPENFKNMIVGGNLNAQSKYFNYDVFWYFSEASEVPGVLDFDDMFYYDVAENTTFERVNVGIDVVKGTVIKEYKTRSGTSKATRLVKYIDYAKAHPIGSETYTIDLIAVLVPRKVEVIVLDPEKTGDAEWDVKTEIMGADALKTAGFNPTSFLVGEVVKFSSMRYAGGTYGQYKVYSEKGINITNQNGDWYGKANGLALNGDTITQVGAENNPNYYITTDLDFKCLDTKLYVLPVNKITAYSVVLKLYMPDWNEKTDQFGYMESAEVIDSLDFKKKTGDETEKFYFKSNDGEYLVLSKGADVPIPDNDYVDKSGTWHVRVKDETIPSIDKALYGDTDTALNSHKRLYINDPNAIISSPTDIGINTVIGKSSNLAQDDFQTAITIELYYVGFTWKEYNIKVVEANENKSTQNDKASSWLANGGGKFTALDWAKVFLDSKVDVLKDRKSVLAIATNETDPTSDRYRGLYTTLDNSKMKFKLTPIIKLARDKGGIYEYINQKPTIKELLSDGLIAFDNIEEFYGLSEDLVIVVLQRYTITLQPNGGSFTRSNYGELGEYFNTDLPKYKKDWGTPVGYRDDNNHEYTIVYTIDDKFPLPMFSQMTPPSGNTYTGVMWQAQWENGVTTESNQNWITTGTQAFNHEYNWKNEDLWGDITLLALWKTDDSGDDEEKVSVLTIDADGGIYIDSELKQIFGNPGETYQVVNPTRSGYVFEGWDFNATNSGAGANLSGNYINDGYMTYTFGASGETVLTAIWRENTQTVYTLTLNLMSGTWYGGYSPTGVVSGSVEFDATYSILTFKYYTGYTFNLPSSSHVSRNGYVLLGWQDIRQGSHNILFSPTGQSVVTGVLSGSSGDTTLIAIWQQPTTLYPLYYQLDEGEMLKDGSNKFIYSPAAGLSVLASTGTDYDYIVMSVPKGSNYRLPYASEVYKQDYVLTGWRVVAGNGLVIDAEYVPGYEVISMSGSVKFLALWEKLEYQAFLYLGEISSSDHDARFVDTYSSGLSTEINDNSAVVMYSLSVGFTLPRADEVIYAGHTLTGWLIKDHTCPVPCNWHSLAGTTSLPGFEFLPGYYGHVFFQAQWELTTYTITLDGGGGNILDGTPVASKTIEYTPDSDDIILPVKSGMQRDGWRFIGWKWEDDLIVSTIITTNNGEYILSVNKGSSGNATFVAQWSNLYAIDLQLNGGKWIDGDINVGAAFGKGETNGSIVYTKNSNFMLPDESVTLRTGYSFVGWKLTTLGEHADSSVWGTVNVTIYSNANGNMTINDGRVGDVVMTAVWSINEYIVTLDATPGELKGYTLEATNEKTNTPRVDGNKIYYTIEDTFVLPTAEQTVSGGRVLSNWKLTANPSMIEEWASVLEYAPGTSISGKYGSVVLTAQWELTPYTITLVLDDGKYTSAQLTNYKPSHYGADETFDGIHIIYTIADNFNLPQDELKREGYDFTNWKLQSKSEVGNWSDHDIESVISTYISGKYGDITIYANWDMIEYTLKYVLNGGSINDKYNPTNVVAWNKVDTVKYTVGSSYTIPNENEAQKRGYTLTNWTLTDVGEVNQNWGSVNSKYSNGAYINTGRYGNVVLTAEWQINIYQITLDLDNGKLKDYQLDATDDETETPSISGNIIKYTVLSEFALPQNGDGATQIEKTGYTFLGWELRGTAPDIKFEPQANPSATYKTGVALGSCGDATLIAVWELIDYTITLVLDEGSEPRATLNDYKPSHYSADEKFENLIINYTIEDTFALPNVTQITRTGATFKGWELTELGEGASATVWGEIGSVVSVIKAKYGNIKITASWDIVSYVITLLTGGGTLDTDKYGTPVTEITQNEQYSITYTSQISIELPSNISQEQITRTGYTFLGWELRGTAPDIKFEPQANPSAPYKTGVAVGSKGNATLIAKWKLIEYSITLVLDDGIEPRATLNGYKPANYGEDEQFDGLTIKYTIEDDTFDMPVEGEIQRNGFSFLGWKITSTDGNWPELDTYITVANKGSYGNVEITANWQIIEYVITLLTNGGTLNTVLYDKAQEVTADSEYTVTYTIQTQTFALPIGATNEIFKLGYGFKGWQLNGTALDIKFEPQDNPSASYKTGIALGSKGNATLTAVWEVGIYNLTLITNGGAIDLNEYKPNVTDIIVSETNNIYIVKYTIEQAFDLPSTQMSKPGAEFNGWILSSGGSTIRFNKDGSFVTAILQKSYGEAVLTADWRLTTYYLTLQPSTGELKDYNPQGVLDFKDNVIAYNIESTIILPSELQIVKSGHTMTGWLLTASDGIKGNDWGTVNVTTYLLGAEIANKIGTVTLTAQWDENEYTIVLNSNNKTGETYTIKPVKYSEDVIIDRDVSYSNHVFVGWAMVGYETTQTYKYIEDNFTETSIVEDFGTSILKNGLSVSKLTKVNGNIVNIYAIWLPVYTITIHKGDNATIYESDKPSAKATFIEHNNYYQEHKLYKQLDEEVFNKPISTSGTYRLYRRGYYISGWRIVVNGVQYYVKTATKTPLIDDWAKTNNVENLVQAETNMQYLQGNINAYPQWTAFEFDVRFVTKSGAEKYKADYSKNKDLVSTITYDAQYKIQPSSQIGVVQSTDIKAYTVIYAHPYNGTSIDDKTTITIDGVWNYDIQYKRYTADDVYTQNTGWYIIIEGYYAPNLYQLKIDLNLPYTSKTPTITLNDFALEEINSSQLNKIYRPVYAQGGKYVNSQEYIDRQNVLYLDNGGQYYIYLLQDQIIKDKKIYDAYYNGKAYTDTSGVGLPIFELPYYEMQYYYTFNDSAAVYRYAMTNLESEHISHAMTQFENLGASKIVDAVDWKYQYCNINDDLNQNDNYVLELYWFRNLINVKLNNLLKDNNTINGYALIIENEQVTATLLDHNKYNLVIYTSVNRTYKYLTYGFNDESLLIDNGKYAYTRFNSLTDEDCIGLGITKTESNIIPIFFGNSFIVRAIDQSKDHSLDEFIGYRFDNYAYDITNKDNQPGTCSSLNELNSYTNDGVNYSVTVDLMNYEYNKATNTTNYFKYKDMVTVNVNFGKINYTINYQVTNNNNVYVSKYGFIKLQYVTDSKEGSQFEYTVNVDADNTLTSKFYMRLGGQIDEWRLVNDYVVQKTVGTGEIYEFILNPQYLRNNLYLNIYNKPLSQYSSNPEQVIGYINAVCSDVEFAIHVNVKDISKSKNNIIRTYILTNDESNKLFSIKNSDDVPVTSVSIENVYKIVMLTKASGDEYVYYYQNDGRSMIQYAVLGLYIGHSQNHSANLLVNKFAYPQTNLKNIDLNVTESLLDGSINYTQYAAITPENKHLDFYIEVSPTVEISFEISNHEHDKLKGERSILFDNITVASAIEGQALEVNKAYLGYVGQSTTIKIVADNPYYSSAELQNIYDGTIPDSEITISANSNTKYEILAKTKIVVKLIPKVYSFDAIIEYQEQKYSATDYDQIRNASGVNIFDSTKGVVIGVARTNSNPGQAIYYYGDKIVINYSLNSSIADDFDVIVQCVGGELEKNSTGYIATFVGKDITITILVEAKTELITLSTNINNKYVAEICAQVNDGEPIVLLSEGNPDKFPKIKMINGDKLHVYIKDNTGYKFTNSYQVNDSIITVSVEDGEGIFVGYKKFTLFSEGFKLSDANWYTLIFKQIPVNIEFKYNVTIPDSGEDANAGANYIATHDTTIVEKDTIVTLTKGKDNPGYRFIGYSYNAPLSDETNAKIFDFSTENESQAEFVMQGDLWDYIGVQPIVEDKINLTVYINYIKQYTFDIVYQCNEKEIISKITNSSGDDLAENVYYDYNTETIISLQTLDNKHYQIDVQIKLGYNTEIINTATIAGANIVEDSLVLTNIGNLAGFIASRNLTDSMTITIKTIVEKYDTILNQNLYLKPNASELPQTAQLMGKNEDFFNLDKNIYYQVKATHEYGSKVEINIFVLKPVDRAQQYYAISNVYLNDIELKVNSNGEGKLGELEGYYYTFSYDLTGDELPTELKLDVNFKALYYVEITNKKV